MRRDNNMETDPLTEAGERKRAESLLSVEHDLSIALSCAVSLDDALDYILDTSFRIEGIDCGGIYLVNRSNGELHLACHRGLSARFVEQSSYYPAAAAQTRLVMTGKPIYRRSSQLSTGPARDSAARGSKSPSSHSCPS